MQHDGGRVIVSGCVDARECVGKTTVARMQTDGGRALVLWVHDCVGARHVPGMRPLLPDAYITKQYRVGTDHFATTYDATVV